MTATTTATRRPRPRCRCCGFPAPNRGALVNGYCSTACSTAAIINAAERRMRAGR